MLKLVFRTFAFYNFAVIVLKNVTNASKNHIRIPVI